eukprot:750546-Hanusia_phi.AAC.2
MVSDAIAFMSQRCGSYDLRFPELFVALREAGAHLILVPSAFMPTTGEAHWEVRAHRKRRPRVRDTAGPAASKSHRDSVLRRCRCSVWKAQRETLELRPCTNCRSMGKGDDDDDDDDDEEEQRH